MRVLGMFSAAALLVAGQAVAAEPSAVAQAAFERGEKALGENQFPEAQKAYEEALASSPQFAAALNGLGSALFKQSRRDEAIARFKQAVALDPGLKLAWYNLGYASRKGSDFRTAADAYEKYTALDPADADGFYGLGESYRQLGDAQKAIAAYDMFLKKETRASEQKWIDRAKEAIASLRASAAPAAPVAAAPSPAPASAAVVAPAPSTNDAAPMQNASAKRIAEGDKLMGEKKFREALFAYLDATHADPNNVEGLFKLGNANAVLGYYTQAVDAWSKVTSLSKDPAVRQKASDNIARAQTKLAEQGGGSPPAAGQGPGQGPLADTTREQARAAYEQGVRFVISKDYSKALSPLTESVKLEPGVAKTYIARGSALMGLRRFAEAAVDYQYALKLDPSAASPLYGLAEAYFGLSRFEDARPLYEQYVAASTPDVRTDLQAAARQRLEQIK